MNSFRICAKPFGTLSSQFPQGRTIVSLEEQAYLSWIEICILEPRMRLSGYEFNEK